jgi:hypothetical protein
MLVLDVAIMVEGREGVGWDRWRRIARAVEDLPRSCARLTG